MQEPSLLDLLKQVFNRHRLCRGALMLAGLYLLGTGTGKLIRTDESEAEAVIRLALGVASLAAIRFIRPAQGTASMELHGEQPAIPLPARWKALLQMKSRNMDWMQWIGTPIAFLIILTGSRCLSRPDPRAGGGLILLGAGMLLLWVIIRRRGIDLERPSLAECADSEDSRIAWVRFRVAAGAFGLSILTFISLSENQFTLTGGILWLSSMIAWLAALWEGSPRIWTHWRMDIAALWRGGIQIHLTNKALLLIVIMILAVTFRFALLNAVPSEMTSDHVEDLLDVNRILSNGERPIFAVTNGGREPLDFYLAALAAHFTGTELTHLTLKIVSAAAGFLTLPFIFLLAREIADDDLTGLLAMLAASIAWWPNVLGRLGLRLPLAALFAAIALWLMVRAIKHARRNAALLAGLVIGIGMYGYTPIRIVPLTVTVALAVYAIHSRTGAAIRRAARYWTMITIVAVAAIVPLLRYSLGKPAELRGRILTAITGDSRAAADLTLHNFLRNEWNSLRMFHWTSDQAWLVSPSGQPALDWVMAGLLLLGSGFVLYRYLRRREWLDLFLLISVPLLLLPSTLSLAFDGRENPSLPRSSAAIPIVFALVGTGLQFLIKQCRLSGPPRAGNMTGIMLTVVLLAISAGNNWRIVFHDYDRNYTHSTQNASEMSRVIQGFARSVGSYDTAYIKGYPYWVDVRAVGIQAGNFGWEQSICDICRFRDAQVMKDDARPKLFLAHPMDGAFAAELRKIYPEGNLARYRSKIPDRDFLIYFVPGRQNSGEGGPKSP